MRHQSQSNSTHRQHARTLAVGRLVSAARWAALAMGLVFTACGQDPSCVAGATNACVCTDGAAGAQVCNADGSGFSDCTCSSPADGAGNDSAGADTEGADTAAGTDAGTADTADTAADSCDCAKMGSQCGFMPKCPKSCGSCPLGKKCEANKCIAGGPVKTPFGGACGPSKTCPPPPAGAAQSVSDAYFACLDNSCEDGRCRNGVCIKSCTMSKDDVQNATGAAGPDGVEDPDANSDCDDALDGPYGDKFRCIEFRAPAEVLKGSSTAYCYPGQNWKPCKGSGECGDGESCQLRYAFGKYGTYCVPKHKPPTGKSHAQLTETCNSNPFAGTLAICASNWCSSSWGCRAFCKDDSDCVTAVGACKAGTCSNIAGLACKSDADCSAQFCKSGLQYYSNVEQTFSMCYPKSCKLTSDCPSGTGCRVNTNGVVSHKGDPDPADSSKVILPGWDHLCLPHKPGGVAAGELCDKYPSDDNADDPFCENPSFCRDGFCGNLCISDADCKANMKCGASEYGFDTDDDGLFDYRLASDHCVGLPSAGTVCVDNAGCEAGQVCKPWVHKSGGKLPGGASEYTSSGRCIAKIPGRAQFAGYCGAGKDGVQCQTDICLPVFTGQDYGVCTDTCNSRFDCPAKVKIGNTTYKSLCSARWIMSNQTLLDPNDDVYIPVCWPSAESNSLEDCSATRTCPVKGEACSARAISRGPDQGAKVEYVCVRVNGTSGPLPTKAVGEACDPAADDNPCLGGLCLEDIKAGTGYCSALCLDDSACGGLFCDVKRQQIARADASKAAIVPMCVKDTACIPCTYDNNCSNGKLCSNVGGPGTLADRRCTPPCASDADCAKAAKADGKVGGKCVDQRDRFGDKTGVKVCAVTCG